MYEGIRSPRKGMIAGLFLFTLFLFVFSFAYGEEKAAVTLLSVSPAEGSYISRTPKFTLTFDKNVANQAVRERNRDLVSFMDSGGNAVLTHVEIADDEIYPTLKRIIEVHVLETLSPGRYKLVVAAGIQAKNGTRTSESYTFYYRVKAEEASETETESETEAESETESASETESDPVAVSEAETETESASETAKESNRESESEVQSGRPSESASKTEIEDEEDSQSSSGLESVSDNKPEDSPGSQNDGDGKKQSQKDTDKEEKSDLDPVEKSEEKEARSNQPSLALYEILVSPEAETGQALLRPSDLESAKVTGHGPVSVRGDLAWALLGLLAISGFVYRLLKFKKDTKD